MGGKWKQYTRKSVECPFYKKENRQVVYCSGVAENSSIHLAFGTPTDCQAYKDTICTHNYKFCRVYKMLEEVDNG